MVRRVVHVLALFVSLPLFASSTPVAPADLTAPAADAERSEDGLATKRLITGTGTAVPGKETITRIRYTVWKSDGTLVQHIAPPHSVLLAVKKMLPGWSAAVRKMVVGETRRAWIPHSLGGGKIPEGESLVIDTELLELIDRPTTPPDVAAPPADAVSTSSGLAYKVLRSGDGESRPTRRSTVVVHYTGWTTDGAMFDSSILRGQPGEFPLTAVIRGWTEGLQLMQVGEKRRFWIPSRLAYGRDRSKPQGMLVFDIELIAIR